MYGRTRVDGYQSLACLLTCFGWFSPCGPIPLILPLILPLFLCLPSWVSGNNNRRMLSKTPAHLSFQQQAVRSLLFLSTDRCGGLRLGPLEGKAGKGVDDAWWLVGEEKMEKALK